MSDDIRIYVADLAAYNAGHVHGIWISATDDLELIQEQVSTMLAASPVAGAEEYAIHDYKGFGGYSLSEYEGLQAAHNIACFITEYPDFGGALLSHFGDLEQAQQTAEDHYCGCYQSLAEYAQEITEESTAIPENLVYYIDYQAMARDMVLSNEVFTITTGFDEVHIFWNH